MHAAAEAQDTAETKIQSNFKDPKSRVMKTSQNGFQQCYNAQIAADGENQLIVTTAVSLQTSERGNLPWLLAAVRAHLVSHPQPTAGYCNKRDLQELESLGIEGCVALGWEWHAASGRCPGGGGHLLDKCIPHNSPMK